MPECDAAAVQVVGGQLHLHPVAGKNPDVVAAHSAGDVRQNLVLGVEHHAEHGVGEGFGDLALNLDGFFPLFSHAGMLPKSDDGSARRALG